MTTVALVGPGAIGGTVAAWLAHAGQADLVVCARTPFDRLVVEVPGGATLDVAPRLLTDPSAATPVDWVIAVTKAYATAAAAQWVARLVGPHTCVAVLQNGVEHMERFAALVPRERTLPVITDIPAERSAPGRIVQRRHGLISAPAGELGARFAALFQGTPLTVSLTDDFLSVSWRKLVLNSAGVVNALTLKPAGVARNDKAAALMRAIAEESASVARAAGAHIEASLPEEVVERYRTGPPDAINSLLADRLAGRPLEVDARNGAVVREGARRGVPTPLNWMAVALLEAAAAV
jgi:2-dehydropantoate 2-reductase